MRATAVTTRSRGRTFTAAALMVAAVAGATAVGIVAAHAADATAEVIAAPTASDNFVQVKGIGDTVEAADKMVTLTQGNLCAVLGYTGVVRSAALTPRFEGGRFSVEASGRCTDNTEVQDITVPTADNPFVTVKGIGKNTFTATPAAADRAEELCALITLVDGTKLEDFVKSADPTVETLSDGRVAVTVSGKCEKVVSGGGGGDLGRFNRGPGAN